MDFKIVLEEDPEDGGYVVSCPSLPGCHSQGDTKREALKNIKEAIEAYLESMLKERLALPKEVHIEISRVNIPVNVHG